ncbi:DUF3375 domain-containing protein [Ursidibacter arcticus]
MSFQALQAKYQRLYQESKAWRLLRVTNAPYILGFINDLFQNESEISYGQARLMLEVEIDQARELGIWETETPASSYLNEWIAKGWLREMDDILTKTDSTELAIRFIRQLDERAMGASASHLRIVQDAVRDLSVALSQNVDVRIAVLQAKRNEIEQEISELEAGVISELDQQQQRERIKEIYQLASLLTGDFRRLEEEIRQLDKDLRVKMIAEDEDRGSILQHLMEQEELLDKTEAGSAFEGFFQLLCDSNRSTEFREQLRQILDSPAAEYLSPFQQQFLAQLVRELSRESERIFKIRRRTEQELRSYIESGAFAENQAIDRLIKKLESLAVKLQEQHISLSQETQLYLPISPIGFSSPDTLKLRYPEEQLEVNTTEQINSRQVSHNVLQSIERIQIRQIAEKIRHTLQEQGALTLANLTQYVPITAGLEELVAYIRVAKATHSLELEGSESLCICDRKGRKFKVKIPKLLLDASLFPSDINELNL